MRQGRKAAAPTVAVIANHGGVLSHVQYKPGKYAEKNRASTFVLSQKKDISRFLPTKSHHHSGRQRNDTQAAYTLQNLLGQEGDQKKQLATMDGSLPGMVQPRTTALQGQCPEKIMERFSSHRHLPHPAPTTAIFCGAPWYVVLLVFRLRPSSHES